MGVRTGIAIATATIAAGCGFRAVRVTPRSADAGRDARRNSDAAVERADVFVAPDVAQDDGGGAIPACEPPRTSIVGRPCTDDGDCSGGLRCVPEYDDRFEGRDYVEWAEGYCLLVGRVGRGGCDPADEVSCPRGSVCLYAGFDAAGEGITGGLDAGGVGRGGDPGVPRRVRRRAGRNAHLDARQLQLPRRIRMRPRLGNLPPRLLERRRVLRDLERPERRRRASARRDRARRRLHRYVQPSDVPVRRRRAVGRADRRRVPRRR